MGTQKTASACYLCGSTENLTKDHIPPECLFPKPKPTNLITLPCCKTCHEPTGLDDEAFHIWVAAGAKNEAGRRVFQESVIESSFKRSQKLFKNVQKHVRTLPFKIDEQIVQLPAIQIPAKRADKVLIRITKGLLTKFAPQYDFKLDRFKAMQTRPLYAPHEELLKKLIPMCPYYLKLGDGVFDCFYGFTKHRWGAVWIYFFYEDACCIVMHGPFNDAGIVAPW